MNKILLGIAILTASIIEWVHAIFREKTWQSPKVVYIINMTSLEKIEEYIKNIEHEQNKLSTEQQFTNAQHCTFQDANAFLEGYKRRIGKLKKGFE